MNPDSRLAARLDLAVALGLVLLGFAGILGVRLGAIAPGEEVAMLRVGMGILSLAVALLWLRLGATRRELARMDDLLDDVRFGSGTKRDRDAVDILIRALRGDDPRVRETALRTLRKITRQEFGGDAAAWERWWSTARPTFTRARPGPSPGKK